MKKILVSDYDDTFYLNDEDINNNLELLEKNKDKILFIIATGRSYYDYLKKQKKYNIKCSFVILNHGATIIENNNIIYNESINNVVKEEIINLLNSKGICEMFCCSGLLSRISSKSDCLTKIHVRYGDKDQTKDVYQELKKKYSDYINCFLVSKSTAIEIVSNKVDKKNAIMQLIDIKKWNREDIYTIGDNDTDYEMLNHFKGYKMMKCSKKINDLEIESVKSVSDLIKIIVN